MNKEIKIKQNSIYDGIIDEIKSNGIIVELDNGYKGLVQPCNIANSDRYYVGDSVKVKVISFKRKKEQYYIYIYLKFQDE
jgi:ribosomal protein S1